MKKNLNKKKIILVVAAALFVALIAAASVRLSTGQSDPVTGGVDVVMKPVRSLMSSVADDFGRLYGYLYRYDQLETENADLKAQVSKLEQEYQQYGEVSDENARLRSLLGLSQRNADYAYTDATVISWTSSSWSSAFTMDRGSSGGVKVGDPVITENGYLVGRVTAVSLSSATVTTILDTSSSIGAEDSQTNELAVAGGDFSLMKDRQLKLRYLPENYEVKAGDTIVTSGSGGAYPQGLVIGAVDSIALSSSGLDDAAVIEPSADFANLEFVYVITSFDAD